MFDYRIGTPPADLYYSVVNRDVIKILGDIANVIGNVGFRVAFDFASLGGAAGITHNYQKAIGDMSYFNSIIDDLAGIGDGFDWWVTWDKRFLWASPYRFGLPANPTYLETIDETVPVDDLQFTNNGPVATHITGTGSGTTTGARLAASYGYDVNQETYSRFDADYDFGDLRNNSALNARTQKQLTLDVQPHHDITLILNPLDIDPSGYWANFRVGRAIYLNYDLGYHIINSGQRLKQMNGIVDSEGNAQVTWTLEQIYDLDLSAGIKEG
jgi:hypothetical protein